MSLQTYGWLVLAFPLAGTVLIALSSQLVPSKLHGYLGTLAIALSFLSALGALFALQDLGEEERQVVTVGVGLREHRRRRRAAVAAARPAVGVHGARRLRRVDADPPLLDLLHGVRPRLHALLRVPELLRLLDAAAGPGRELLLPDRRLGVRRRGVVPADQLLVPAHDGHRGRHQGVRDQRRRRRRPGARDVLHLQAHRLARLPHGVRAAPASSPATTATSSRAACCCWSARSRSPRRCRCTPGSRTRWRARRRSPR